MDEQDDHWKDILSIAKDNKAKQHPVTELDVQKTAQLNASVHAHIDQQFNLTALEEIEHDNPTTQASEKNAFLGNISGRLRQLKEQLFSIGRAPALAFVATMVISFGLFTSTSETATPFLDIPDSLFKANLDKQLVLTRNAQRALSSNSSQRRNAFVMGTIRADLDTAHESDGDNAAAIINNYPNIFEASANTTIDAKLTLFQAQIEELAQNDQSKFWLEEGYLVEMIHLSSLHALNNAQMPPLNDALQFFQQLTDLENIILNSEKLSPDYINNRKQITTNNRNETFVPGEVQRIIDLTQSLQVLVQ